ncbi:MAG: lipase/acyltransferase domain-containing protein, partial [Chloroflexota bacterium]
DLGDGVEAPGIVPDIHLIPGLWKIDGYSKIADTIKARFAVTPGHNYFEFPYDWRRDNRVAARRLARLSHDWLKAWRAASGRADAKLILVAHSMGGLVSRYFLECLDGWQDTRALITFGTPYRGALNALDFLANGMTKKVGPIPVLDVSDLLRSFTSTYQLLPIYACYDAGDGPPARVAEVTGIPNVDAEKAAAALTFHRQIEAAVNGHLQDEAYLRNRYAIHPMVGIFQPTLQSARLVGNRVELERARNGKDEGGDGTVPRVSATPIEFSNQGRETYIADRHGSIQNGTAVLDQLVGVLSGLSFTDLAEVRVEPAVRLALDIEDAYVADEPVRVRARSNSETVDLQALVVNTASGSVAAQATLGLGDGGWLQTTVAPLPAGTYRVTVRDQSDGDPDSAPAPVSDLFVVFDAT